jgi:ligand-binding sensor domain-containing protein/signal transduction histidine kinase
MLLVRCIPHFVILILWINGSSCIQKKDQMKSTKALPIDPIKLHRTQLSALPTKNKPVPIILESVPKPKTTSIKGHTVENSTNNWKHFFNDQSTGLPIPENAQGRGLFTSYTSDAGLAIDQVYCSYKDRNGNLWFGTNGGGISKYNGKTFTNYNKQHGLANNVVWCILEDKKGNFWFGTDGNGVSKFDGKRFTNYSVTQGLANEVVISIKEDKNGHLWFGTLKGGVSKFDGKKFTNFSTSDGLANNNVRGIIEDQNGAMWFATFGGGLSRFYANQFTTYTIANGLASDTLRSIYQDTKGNIWLATNSNGLSKYDGKVFTTYNKGQGLADNKLFTVTEDTKGNIWVGTKSGGASKFDGQKFTNYASFQGLNNNTVRTITEDDRGNIWFGTFGGGVSKFEGNSFSNFTLNQGLSNVVYSITEDISGNLWLGTYGSGVYKYDRKSFIYYNTAHGLSNNSIYATAKDRKGNLWFGTDGSGVVKFDGTNFTTYTTIQGLANNTVFCIKEDKEGNLWFGTSGGGLSKFDGKSFTTYSTLQGLPNNQVFCITEDRKGNLWLGTSGAGISRFDGKSFINFSNAQGLADDMIWAITEDAADNIWIGTQQGISILTKNNLPLLQSTTADDTTLTQSLFQNYTTSDGLPDNFVTQIIQTNDQHFYIGTNAGICEMLVGASTTAPEKTWHVGKIYNSKTGYPVKDVNAGSGAMLKDRNGIIWIGTGSDKTGLVRFDPEAETSNSKKLPVIVIESIKINEESLIWNDLLTNDSASGIIEEMNVFNRTLSEVEKSALKSKYDNIQFKEIGRWYPIPTDLVLPADKNSITFNFNAIETGKNQQVKYQYILEGYNKNWSPADYVSSATFGNIFEGTYTFKVRVQSLQGVWSDPITYTFKVLPPWWRTWWMYLIFLASTVAIIVFIFRWNFKRIINQKKALEEKVDIATQKLRTEKENVEAQKLNVEGALKELKATQAQLIQAEKMASLGELTSGIAHEIQNPLNFVNNFSEVSTELVDEMNEEIATGNKQLSNGNLEQAAANLQNATEIANDLKQNLEKINHHGKRAGDIVKGMLQHSRTNSGVKEPTDINKLADEYLRLAYHGLRAKDKSFNATMKTDFDESIGKIDIIPQDIGRVILNLITNAFYVVNEKSKTPHTSRPVGTGSKGVALKDPDIDEPKVQGITRDIESYEPTVWVTTKLITPPLGGAGGRRVLISVRDNGGGIPPKILDKIFQPFFTTKPTGQGTGLGLSLSYDIVKAHGGELKVETKPARAESDGEGEGTTFIIQIPA